MTIETHRECETEAIAERLAGLAAPGLVVCLSGPLGAGKTSFVRGFALGLGIDERDVHSPTFLTAAEYRGRLPLVHLDLYRHEDILPPSDWLAEMLEGEGVAAVEWCDRLGGDQPVDAVRVDIACGPGRDDRRLELSATGPRAAAVLAAFGGASGAAPSDSTARHGAGR